MEALVGGCDLLIIPSTPDRLSLDALVDTVAVLRSLGADRWRVLLTMIPPPPSRAGELARAVLEEAGFPIFKGSIRRYTAFQTASDLGVIVSEVKDAPGALGWEDYAENWPGGDAVRGKLKGLLEEIKETQAGRARRCGTTPLPCPAPVNAALTERRKPGRPKGGKSSDPGFRPDHGLRRGSGAYRGQESPARHEGHGLQRPGQ